MPVESALGVAQRSLELDVEAPKRGGLLVHCAAQSMFIDTEAVEHSKEAAKGNRPERTL